MFRSLDHLQGATLFLAKIIFKMFTKFLYINSVLCHHVVLCNSMLLGMRLAMLYHRQAHSQQHTVTQPDMLPQHPFNVKEICECFKMKAP